jgi:endonuclease/exonuclease/phosphatase (EEP) superfamily protein YafD
MRQVDTTPGQRVPMSFSVVSWNLHKKCHTASWSLLFNQICSQFSPLFFLFQEFDFHKKSSDLYHKAGYHFNFLPNLSLPHRRGTLCGVATLSRIAGRDHTPFLTVKREPLTATVKPVLVSRYPLENGMVLLLINIHGINFVRSNHFKKQLDQLGEILHGHHGPAIIGGDFNSWSKKRVESIEKFLNSVPHQHYSEVSFGHGDKYRKRAPLFWKIFFGNHSLDRCYYSSDYLKVDAEPAVITKINETPLLFSDHLPLFVKFKII